VLGETSEEKMNSWLCAGVMKFGSKSQQSSVRQVKVAYVAEGCTEGVLEGMISKGHENKRHTFANTLV